jgi:hemolysin activation/secretion protein
VTYGSVGVTYGKLSLDSELKKAGETTARTDGDYDKININLARIQLLPNNFSLYANVSSQFSRQNLDSSEGFGLGGKSGVRAYPSGEAYGDEGWLYNLEFRKKIKSFTPYVFYDAGRIRINSDPWDDSNNHRSLSGAGLGIRYSSNNGINADISSAWRIGGGEPTSDSKDKNPQIWFNIGYEF